LEHQNPPSTGTLGRDGMERGGQRGFMETGEGVVVGRRKGGVGAGRRRREGHWWGGRGRGAATVLILRG
jgi:hypothetical protein